MSFKLRFAKVAAAQYADVESNGPEARLKKVRKCLGLLSANPRHPGLNSHKYSDLTGANDEAVFEVYVENNTPSAWRVFWHYGPGKDVITVVAITPHP